MDRPPWKLHCSRDHLLYRKKKTRGIHICTVLWASYGCFCVFKRFFLDLIPLFLKISLHSIFIYEDTAREYVPTLPGLVFSLWHSFIFSSSFSPLLLFLLLVKLNALHYTFFLPAIFCACYLYKIHECPRNSRPLFFIVWLRFLVSFSLYCFGAEDVMDQHPNCKSIHHLRLLLFVRLWLVAWLNYPVIIGYS